MKIKNSLSVLNKKKKIIFCKKCVNSSLRPRLKFDKNGVCYSCLYSIKKHQKINWKKREQELLYLLDKHRSKNGKHDIIVPSSGGKDSGYVAHILKHKYGMNPLAVSWAPGLYTKIGWLNLMAFCKKIDTFIYVPNRELHSKLSRIAFEEFGDIFQPWQYGMEAYPQKIAIKFNIPLVMYGENQWVEYSGGHLDEEGGENTLIRRKLNQNLRVKSGVDKLIQIGIKKKIFNKNYLKKNMLVDDYRLPSENEASANKTKSYFFSYFKKWIPHQNYYYAAENCGLNCDIERTEGTFTKYASLDDKLDEIYYYFQYLKFGFGRCTSDASCEIRDGYISRKEGVNLVKLYDGEFPLRYLKDSLEYMKMNRKQFDKIVEKFRNKYIWKKNKFKKWELRHKVK